MSLPVLTVFDLHYLIRLETSEERQAINNINDYRSYLQQDYLVRAENPIAIGFSKATTAQHHHKVILR